jgi:hypothetical protein
MADELYSQSTRVRDLIGSVHWLSDGHHKESLLRNFLSRNLPSGMTAARGFVISPGNETACSREQDILIVDTTREPPVFSQSDLIIAFPRTVVAAVSVKTTMDQKEVHDSIGGLNSVRSIATLSGGSGSIWCGSFHFEHGKAVVRNPRLPYRYFESGIKASPLIAGPLPAAHAEPIGPDIVCSAKDLAFAFRYKYSDNSNATTNIGVRGFSCEGHATAIFLAALLDHIAIRRSLPDADFARFAEGASVKPLKPPEHTFQVRAG